MDTPTSPQISLAQLFSMTVQFIQAADAAFPPGSGKDKLDTVMAQVQAFTPLVLLGADVLDKLMPSFINVTVAMFNKLGIFAKPKA